MTSPDIAPDRSMDKSPDTYVNSNLQPSPDTCYQKYHYSIKVWALVKFGVSYF